MTENFTLRNVRRLTQKTKTRKNRVTSRLPKYVDMLEFNVLKYNKLGTLSIEK